ncbi:hypothetical protein OIU84_026646, partial [Salix udensis]
MNLSKLMDDEPLETVASSATFFQCSAFSLVFLHSSP